MYATLESMQNNTEIVFNTIYVRKHIHLHDNNKCQLQISLEIFERQREGKHQEGGQKASAGYMKIFFKKKKSRGFPGGPAVKIGAPKTKGPGLTWSGN